MQTSFSRLLIAAGVGLTLFAVSCSTPPPAAPPVAQANCAGLPDAAKIKTLLKGAASKTGPDGDAGGLFSGERMWGAVVNREGKFCAVAASQDDPTQVWPGSQSIAKAKAYTANAFSLDSLALSTARLYTFTQPGHSLWSLAGANPFRGGFLAAPDGTGGGLNEITGGMIFFGGGVPLYANGKIIGGLGISGDTSCTDHEIAKRVRDAGGLNPPGGKLVDDIQYSKTDKPGVFTHPLCLNTFRNGMKIGDEAPSSGY
jgi:uncharacterized protein GlcG (DUF336 family)